MLPPNTSDGTNSSTPIVSLPSMNKRKASRPVSDVSVAVKKSCAMLPMNSSAAAGNKFFIYYACPYSFAREWNEAVDALSKELNN